MSKLNTTVLVRDTSGRAHVLGPDSIIPEWAETAITNPYVWEEPPVREDTSAERTISSSTPAAGAPAATPSASPKREKAKGSKPKSKGKGTKSEVTASELPPPVDVVSDTSEEPEDVKAPPKTGPGSGTEAWRAYAVAAVKRAGLSIDIADDAGRGDIIEALTTAGIATE